MYNIIQSYNTFCHNGNPDSEREKAGFSTVRSLVSYLKQSYRTHKKYRYTLYTDEAGYENVKWMNEEHVEVIEYPIIDDRIPYTGKFHVEGMQNKPFIHVDLDATLFSIEGLKGDIITEKMRSVYFRKEPKKLGINVKGISEIICSGIIGFSDLSLRSEYLKQVYECIDKLKTDHNLSFETMFTLEEVLLTRLAKDNGSVICSVKEYEHLQGRIK